MPTQSDVTIRPYRVEDSAVVYDAVRESMKELIPWMPWCHPDYSFDETHTWLESQVSAFREGLAFEFAIVAASGYYLGGCGLNHVDKINRNANLGYWVRSGASGHGVAGHAVELIRSWAFENTDLIRLEIVIAVENQRSRRVAEKVKAGYEGILQSRLFLNGSPHDAAIYCFIRE
jgi:RimJ/RimL family protein N-acetyltransferase